MASRGILIDPLSGNVGIGTTSTLRGRMMINPTTSAGHVNHAPGLIVNSTNDGVSGAAWIALNVGCYGQKNRIVMGVYDNTAVLGSHSDTLDAWTPICLGYGNVGIGTTNPQTALQVNGTIKNTNPAFSVGKTDGDVAGGNVIVYNQVFLNTGSGYSNGVFTAPVAGTYFFSWFGMANGSPTFFINMALQVNETTIRMTHGANAAYAHASGTHVCTLNVGDRVRILNVSNYTTIYASAGPYNGFSGYLIG